MFIIEMVFKVGVTPWLTQIYIWLELHPGTAFLPKSLTWDMFIIQENGLNPIKIRHDMGIYSISL